MFKIRSKHSLSNHIDNKKKDILALDKSPAQGLDDTTITEEVESPINISRLQRQFCLDLYLMQPTFFFVLLLILQKYINLKQKILK